jgi:hypothetical protein
MLKGVKRKFKIRPIDFPVLYCRMKMIKEIVDPLWRKNHTGET